MGSSKTVQICFRLNAAFSGVAGLYLVIATDTAASMLFLTLSRWQSWVLKVVGGGLIVFAIALLVMASSRFIPRRWVHIISMMDVSWVVGSIFLLVVKGHVFSDLGSALVAVVAAIVTVFAAGQYVAARPCNIT